MRALLFGAVTMICSVAAADVGTRAPDAPLAKQAVRVDTTASVPGQNAPDPGADDIALECQSGYEPCGADYCSPIGTVCCDYVGHPEGYCNAGYSCTTDGQCVPAGGGGGNDGGYCGDGRYTQASCGGDTCSCAETCSSNGGCNSGCCVGGYCALACVCSGLGTVTYSCGGTDPEPDPVDPYADDSLGCRVGGDDTSLLWMLCVAATIVTFASRRRSRLRA